MEAQREVLEIVKKKMEEVGSSKTNMPKVSLIKHTSLTLESVHLDVCPVKQFDEIPLSRTIYFRSCSTIKNPTLVDFLLMSKEIKKILVGI